MKKVTQKHIVIQQATIPGECATFWRVTRVEGKQDTAHVYFHSEHVTGILFTLQNHFASDVILKRDIYQVSDASVPGALMRVAESLQECVDVLECNRY